MSDFETVAVAEERSFAEQELQELIDKGYPAPVFDGSRWTFPTDTQGEERDA